MSRRGPALTRSRGLVRRPAAAAAAVPAGKRTRLQVRGSVSRHQAKKKLVREVCKPASSVLGRKMWRRVLVSALALAAACDGFAFAPGAPITAVRRASVLPQARAAAPALGVRSLRSVAAQPPKPFEFPPVLGLGFKALGKRLVVITGTTSGLGLSTLKALLRREDSFVVCAVRDVQKMKDIIRDEGMDSSNLAVLKLDLGSFQSVRDFVFNLKVGSSALRRALLPARCQPGALRLTPRAARVQAFKSNFPLDTLVCNAATYQPATPEPRFTEVLVLQLLLSAERRFFAAARQHLVLPLTACAKTCVGANATVRCVCVCVCVCVHVCGRTRVRAGRDRGVAADQPPVALPPVLAAD